MSDVKFNKKYLLAISVGCFILNLQAMADKPQHLTLSIKEAIAMALSQNKEVQASHRSVNQARAELKSSYGKYLPQLNLEGKYTNIDAPLEMDIDSIRTAMIQSSAGAAQAGAASAVTATGGSSATASAAGSAAATATRTQLSAALPPFVEEIQKRNFYNASLTALQPIYTGGKITANKRVKEEGLRISEVQDKATEERIMVDVVNRYYGVQLITKIIEIKKELLESLTEHQAHAEQLLKQGQLSKANKMRTDVALAEAQREYSKALRDKELAEILLSNSLGTNETQYDLTTSLFITDKIHPLEEYSNTALTENSNIKIIKHKQNQLSQKQEVNVSNFLPQVAAFGKYELYRDDLTTLEPNWAIGVGLKMNLFNGASDYYDYKATSEEMAALELFSANVNELIKTEVKKYYHDINTAKEQYDSLKTSLALAQENLRLNKISFNSGVATALEVIDAQLALEKVKVEQMKALYDFDVAFAGLLRSTGNIKTVYENN